MSDPVRFVAPELAHIERHSATSLVVRPVEPADAPPIAAIYNHYIERSVVTFEEVPVTPIDIDGRIADIASTGLPWLVAEEAGRTIGYAYAMRWRSRSAYRFSVEITVYLDPEACGRGVGSALYGALFPVLEAQQIHAVMGGIALPNAPSVALHERFGMQKVAHFRQAGFKFGQWVDVGYWQRVLAA